MPILTNGPSRILGGARAKWYRAGGAPVPVAAYCPKGAASLAASYINLANPGTYDLSSATPPTLSAAGWTGGNNVHLNTGILTTANMTVIVRFSGAMGGVLAGSRDAAAAGLYTAATPAATSYYFQYGANGNKIVINGQAVAAGVLAIAGPNGYLDGVQKTTMLSNTITNPVALYLMALNNNGAVVSSHLGSMQAAAIYSSVLTAAQVAAVSAAMQQL